LCPSEEASQKKKKSGRIRIGSASEKGPKPTAKKHKDTGNKAGTKRVKKKPGETGGHCGPAKLKGEVKNRETSRRPKK